MVIVRFIFCFLLLTTNLFSTSLTVSIDTTHASEGLPITGTLSVQYDETEEVDPDRCTLNSQPLTLTFVGDTLHSSLSIINGKRDEHRTKTSIYRFSLPPQTVGTHLLPSISLPVGGTIVHSPPTEYEILPVSQSSDFVLEASIEGTRPLYVGQQATFVYTIKRKKAIDITIEQLPLLNVEGFQNIGPPQINEHIASHGYHIQEIRQEVESLSSKTVTIGPSLLEGFAYHKDFFGNMTYLKPKLRAEAPPITIEVVPFPEKNRPPSFTGAVGDFSATMTMLSPTTMYIGDKITLSITIESSGPLPSVRLPPLPFSQHFRYHDILPPGDIEGNKKIFILEMRPLSADITEVPAFPFSFFSPSQDSYITQILGPIPIKVQVRPHKTPVSSASATVENTPEPTPEESLAPSIDLIDIAGAIPISNEARSPHEAAFLLFLICICMGISIIVLSLLLRYFRTSWMNRSRKLESLSHFQHAMKMTHQPHICISSIEKALLSRLAESQYIHSPTISIYDLHHDAIVGEVRTFLITIDKRRFSGRASLPLDEITKQAKTIMDKI